MLGPKFIKTVAPNDLTTPIRTPLFPTNRRQSTSKSLRSADTHRYSQWGSIADRITAHADQANLAGFIESDRDFHLGLLALYGNVRLVSAVRELRSQTRMVNLAKMTQSLELPESAREHCLFLDLLESGDGKALEELTIRHLEHIVGWWAGKPKEQ